MQQAKMGGQPVLRVFLKGNEDLSDSLLGRAEGGRKLGAGLRDLVVERYRGVFVVEIRSEPCSRSDLLLQQLAGATFPASGEQEEHLRAVLASPPTRLLEGSSDVVVLSLQTDLVGVLWRNRETGCLVHPPLDWEQRWSGEQKRSFTDQFESTGLLQVGEFKEKVSRVIRMIKANLDAHVLVFNCSTLDPDDTVCNYRGREDTLALRTHRFNLALMEISAQEGISIIDVERLISEMGGQGHTTRALAYSEEAYRAICQEFVRVLTDIGFFETRPLIMQVGRGGR